MTNKLSRLAGAAIAATVLLPSLADQAAAQNLATATIEFDGTVGTTCTFSSAQDGVLAPNASNTELNSTSGTGASAQLTVNANAGVELSFSAPSLVQKPTSYTGAPTMRLRVTGTTGGQLAPFDSGARTVGISYPGDQLTIDATATDSQAFPAGNYTIQTVVTCAAAPITTASLANDD